MKRKCWSLDEGMMYKFWRWSADFPGQSSAWHVVDIQIMALLRGAGKCGDGAVKMTKKNGSCYAATMQTYAKDTPGENTLLQDKEYLFRTENTKVM